MRRLGVVLVVLLGACGRIATAPPSCVVQTDTVVVRGPDGRDVGYAVTYRCKRGDGR